MLTEKNGIWKLSLWQFGISATNYKYIFPLNFLLNSNIKLVIENLKRKKRRRFNLASNDGNGRQCVPESGQGALFAVIAKGSTGPLQLVDQCDQVLHGQRETSRAGVLARRVGMGRESVWVQETFECVKRRGLAKKPGNGMGRLETFQMLV